MTRDEWERLVLLPAGANGPARDGMTPADLICTPEDLAGIDYDRDIADPGCFPFTRGTHASAYRDRPWATRQPVGARSAVEANAHCHHLLASGATGLRVELDAVSMTSVQDMLDLFAGIDLAAVPVTMADDGSGPMVFALWLVAAERRGVAWSALSGVLQQETGRERTFPVQPAIRLMTDAMAFCRAQAPGWCAVAVSGCDLRDTGATARQELSLTLGQAIDSVGHAIAARQRPDDAARGVSVVLSAHGAFFEDIAKLRAGRQVWARAMRQRFGVRSDEACALRIHVQTSRASLHAQELSSNVVRVTYQALAAVLGGAVSLHTRAFDDVLAQPTTDAATLALRTQQVLASECGLAGEIDPFGGSWFVERLTREFADQVWSDIEELAGSPARDGALVREGGGQGSRVSGGDHATRPSADATVLAALGRLRDGVRGAANTMDLFVDCARAGATVGEMCDILRAEWGKSVEPMTR